jgi:translocator protein
VNLNRSDVLRLTAAIMVCEAAGGIGSVFSISAIPSWYAGLAKPWFTPPNWLFAPVWLTLYLLMGIVLYILRTKGQQARPAVAAFGVQLVLNVAWSVVFFGGEQLFYGFVVIVAMWLAILATMVLSYKVSRGAAAALIPYIIWVTIASALNYYVLILNA